MNVRKTIITLTVLHPADYPLDFSSLEHIAEQMNEGDFVGSFTIKNSEQLEPERVKAELLAVGNDGEFFDVYEEND